MNVRKNVYWKIHVFWFFFSWTLEIQTQHQWWCLHSVERKVWLTTQLSWVSMIGRETGRTINQSSDWLGSTWCVFLLSLLCRWSAEWSVRKTLLMLVGRRKSHSLDIYVIDETWHNTEPPFACCSSYRQIETNFFNFQNFRHCLNSSQNLIFSCLSFLIHSLGHMHTASHTSQYPSSPSSTLFLNHTIDVHPLLPTLLGKLIFYILPSFFFLLCLPKLLPQFLPHTPFPSSLLLSWKPQPFRCVSPIPNTSILPLVSISHTPFL